MSSSTPTRLPGVTATLAGRFEHFSDFGSTVNGKFAARWEPLHGYAVRGSLSNGFRAPSLHQQFFTTTSTNFINGVPVDIATLAIDSPAARALGARDLKPEKSVNISVGATANPLRGLTPDRRSLQIHIKDRIVLTETLGTGGTGNTATVQAPVTALLGQARLPAGRGGALLHQWPRHDHEGVDLVGGLSLARWRSRQLDADRRL